MNNNNIKNINTYKNSVINNNDVINDVVKYGSTHFISLYAVILSRLVYFDDNDFLQKYVEIFGNIIPTKLLQSINQVCKEDTAEKIKNDQEMFSLIDENGKPNTISTILGLDIKNDNNRKLETKYLYKHDDKYFLAFNELNIPRNVNIITGERDGEIELPYQLDKNKEQMNGEYVKYISISWSNYGEIFVVADKRMPNMILVLFRGTYSMKTLRISTDINNLSAKSVGCPDDNEKFLYGFYKISVEMIHTVIESMVYLATNFLGANPDKANDNSNKITIFTTGQSLGGALCTNFAYLLCSNFFTNKVYQQAPYNIFNSKIVCISVAAPKSMSRYVTEQFEQMVNDGKIIYSRLANNGDMITALPINELNITDIYNNINSNNNSKSDVTAYSHPFAESNEINKKDVYEKCNTNVIYTDDDYSKNMKCVNSDDNTYNLFNNVNPLYHVVDMNISYLNVSKEIIKSSVKPLEVYAGAGNDAPITRIILGVAAMKEGSDDELQLSVVFVDTSKLQEQIVSTNNYNHKSKGNDIESTITEDVFMNTTNFNKIIDKLSPNNNKDKSPLTPSSEKTKYKIVMLKRNKNDKMPLIACSEKENKAKGGKRALKNKTRKQKKYSHKTRRCRCRYRYKKSYCTNHKNKTRRHKDKHRRKPKTRRRR